MENNIGKICPFCKTEIKAEDAVKECPACGIPHHEGCWVENKGCTTFGCSEQHHEEQGTNPTDTCVNCGAPLGDVQGFCSKCGTPKGAPKKNVCAKCGTELMPGQEFCSRCGQKVDFTVDAAVNSAISQFNAGLEKKKKKTKVIPIVVAVLLIICIGVGIAVSNAVKQKKAEEAYDEYISNVEKFVALSMDAGTNLEDIADTIQKYWYENIWYDKHGYDINDAIYYALRDKSDEITQAEKYDSQMKDLYNKIKTIPEEISDEDIDEIEEICDAVKALYSVYGEYYILATDPSGNYNSYSADNKELTDEYVSCYNILENLIK